MKMKTINLTTAQALVRFLDNQYVSLDGEQTKFIEGVFTIFGHGCCVGLGEALSQKNDHNLTVYQGRNEQGMGHAAIAYAKEHNRRKILPCISSIGPGATNMVTAAATATINRLPALFLPGDTFACRQPDPVLQQIEVPHDLSVSVNDCFKPVSRFWDRVTRPEQLISAMLHAMRVLTDPRETGAVTVSLAQDVQGELGEYPEWFFERRVHVIPRTLPLNEDIETLSAALVQAKTPIIICGGGVRYSEAHSSLTKFIEQTGIPVAETQAGKSVLPASHPLNLGGVGVTGTLSANKIMKQADLVLAVGTRLNDFTTASKSAFPSEHTRFFSINVQPYDSVKLNSVAITADAKVTLDTLSRKIEGSGAVSSIKVSAEYSQNITAAREEWKKEKTRLYAKTFPDGLSQMQVLSDLQAHLPKDAIVVAASGSLPGDLERLWENETPDTYHLEYAFSCMGYEVAGAFGAKLAQPDREVYAIVGDGSYLLMHSELLTSIQERVKINVILCDNSGFQCIDNLQRAQGLTAFACELRYREKDGLTGDYVPVDFAANAAAYGCTTMTVTAREEIAPALAAIRASKVSTLLDIKVAKKSMTDGYEAWWRVGTPEKSVNPKTVEAWKELQAKKPSLRAY